MGVNQFYAVDHNLFSLNFTTYLVGMVCGQVCKFDSKAIPATLSLNSGWG